MKPNEKKPISMSNFPRELLENVYRNIEEKKKEVQTKPQHKGA